MNRNRERPHRRLRRSAADLPNKQNPIPKQERERNNPGKTEARQNGRASVSVEGTPSHG